MLRFNHIGLPTKEKQPGEIYVAATKVWVTSWDDHPMKVEFLRYEDDAPAPEVLINNPHIAFETDDIEAELVGQEVILEPFEALPGLTVAFAMKDGAVFEYMKFADK